MKNMTHLLVIFFICIFVGVRSITVKNEIESTCGDSCTWYFDNNSKTLNINGSGTMTDYVNTPQPWYSIPDVKSIVVEGVTTIGMYAFKNMINLVNVTINSNLGSIKRYSFYGCKNLKKINIPDSVTTIGYYAFYKCSNLASIILPKQLKTLHRYSFGGCKALKEVRIPSNVTSIGNGPFSTCPNLKEIKVDENNIVFTSIDGVLFKKIGTSLILIQYPCGKNTPYVIPDNTTSIKAHAFLSCTKLKTLSIPASLETIERGAFSYTSSMISISVNSNNKNFSSVEGILFNKENTTLIRYPCAKGNSYTIPDSVTVINQTAFTGCSKLESVSIPSGVRSVEEYAFNGCKKLKSIEFTSENITIQRRAFIDCISLTSVAILSSNASLAKESFKGCNNIDSVFYNGTKNPCGNNTFDTSNEWSVTCVNEQYSDNKFCGRDFNSSDECISFVSQHNYCYEITAVSNESITIEKRKSASTWEKQTSGCFIYSCDNNTGETCINLCSLNNTKCVNNFCESIDENKYSFEFFLNDPFIPALDSDNAAQELSVMSGINQSEMTIAFDKDETGHNLRMLVFVDNETVAENLAKLVNDCISPEDEDGDDEEEQDDTPDDVDDPDV